MRERPVPRPSHVFVRGSFLDPGEPIAPGVPVAFAHLAPNAQHGAGDPQQRVAPAHQRCCSAATGGSRLARRAGSQAKASPVPVATSTAAAAAHAGGSSGMSGSTTPPSSTSR